VDVARTITEAEHLIQKGVYHACLMDLGMHSEEQDELYLLRKYGQIMMCIVISAKECLRTGCEIGLLGGKVYSKPANFQSPAIPGDINDAFLRFLTIPVVSAVEDDYHVALCREALVHNEPQSVSAWAISAGVAERYLRQKWRSWIGCQPKYTLFLYTVFRMAFAHTCAEYFGASPAERLSAQQYGRWKDYYERNCGVLDAILQRRVQPQISVVDIINSLQVYDVLDSKEVIV
jgi:hypothetical protein